MSPEAWTGKEVTSKADIYSLGIICYHMLTGVLPFDGDTSAQIMYKHLEGDLVPADQVIEDVPAWLCDLCEQMLMIEPEERPGLEEIIDLIETNLNQKEVPLETEEVHFEDSNEEENSEIIKSGYISMAVDRPEDSSTLWDPTQAEIAQIKAQKHQINPNFGENNIKDIELSDRREQFIAAEVSKQQQYINLAIATFCFNNICSFKC